MLEGGDESIDAQFVFDDAKLVRMGLNLDWPPKDFIWFDRVGKEVIESVVGRGVESQRSEAVAR
jgi:hypothetical protein